MKIKLGEKVKDKITGLEGIAVSKCEYLNGCVQYAVQAKIDKDGKIPNEKWVDAQQLEVVEPVIKKETKIIPEFVPGRRTGGGHRNHPGL